ncbi:MAG: gamma-glutamyl kinase [Pseudomonadota bacterium]
MLVFWKEKLVLLALPKTGTSALEKALAPRADIAFLSPPDVKHMPMFRYTRFIKPLFGVIDGARKLETVALVREPVSWLGSWYRYRSRAELEGHPNSTKGQSFDDFVAAYLEESPPPFARVGSPRRFVSNGQGNVAVSHLFQYEQIDLAARFLESRLKTPLVLGRANVSPPADLALAPKLRARLEDACAEEFALWENARRPS